MSLPNEPNRPSTFDPGQPYSARRPRTGTLRRPPTARPDTGASGIGPLPDQQFFPEGEELDEEEEYEEEEPDENGVFAFARPTTAAVGGFNPSDYGTSAPNTGFLPTTAGTSASGATFGFSSANSHSPRASQVQTPTGNMDVGGRMPELDYDPSQPPPRSGRSNMNNSAFAFSMNKNAPEPKSKAPHRPPTGRSMLEKLHLRKLTTASTAMTGMTRYTTTTALSRADSKDSYTESDSGSFKTETTDSRPMQHTRRMRSSAPLIPPSTGGTDMTRESGTRRGLSRGSYGLTEMTGDMTVPDGKTTWGDGIGGVNKDGGEGGSLAGIDLDATTEEEDSPYPEVRASVSNLDDPELPVFTFRVWVLGLFFSVLAGSLNTFFFFRTPAPYISPLIVQVIVYPCGKTLAYLLPIRDFRVPMWLGGSGFSLNPGPFNIKEHTLIVIMANAAVGAPYALYMTVSSELWYGHNFGIGFSILFVLSTQLTGFAFAGICRRFVVWPASMIWPGNLVITTNFNTFHAEDDGFTGGMTRFKFFLIACCAAFAWYFLPGFLFTALSYFSYACWMAPNNLVVNELFGVSQGLGLGILSFDWLQISWLSSPLVTPWWAEANIGLGFIFFFWILVPILYYNNVWEGSFLPVSVIQAADRYGSEYNVFNILTPDIQLNKTAYAEYSPVFLSTAYTMMIMIAFALASSLVIHTAFHHGPRIYRAIVSVRTEADDIHLKLMRNYPEIPHWWFATVFAFCIVTGIIAIEVFHTGLPVWGYLLAVLVPLAYVVPAAFVYAMTGQLVAINLLVELIAGYLFQGEPIPTMLTREISKVYGVQTLVESMNFLQDQKLGHYMKIPPRATFVAQITACALTCLVQVGVKELLFTTVADVCGDKQQNLLTCNQFKNFFTSSILWGLIGPERIFSTGSTYHPCLWAALVGAIIPVILWFWVRKHPRSLLRNVNIPVMLNGQLSIPPATGVNYSSWFVVGFIFQFWIRRRRFAWWSKYNYVLSAALDVGTALCVLVIFLALDLPGASLAWWGNDVYQNTADWKGNSALRIAPATGVGPDSWKI